MKFFMFAGNNVTAILFKITLYVHDAIMQWPQQCKEGLVKVFT